MSYFFVSETSTTKFMATHRYLRWLASCSDETNIRSAGLTVVTSSTGLSWHEGQTELLMLCDGRLLLPAKGTPFYTEALCRDV